MQRAFILLSIIFATTLSNGGEIFQLGSTNWRIAKVVPAGSSAQIELASAEGVSSQVPTVVWKTPHPELIELSVKDKLTITESEQMEFVLAVRVTHEIPLRRLTLRVADSTGEIFQLIPTSTDALKPGRNEIHYRLDATNPQGSTQGIWGGNKDKKLDWPLRVYGIVIGLNPKTPDDQRILLESLEVRSQGEQVEISLCTGNQFNLLLPERTAPPTLTIRNAGSNNLKLSGILKVVDATGLEVTGNISVDIPSGEDKQVELPGDYSKYGWWKIDYQLTSISGKGFSGTHRMVRMKPAGPTPGRAEEFLFGLCSHPERISSELSEQEAKVAGLCGAKILRVGFIWSRFEPQHGQWDFSIYDRLVEEFGSNGLELQPIFFGCPKWAVSTECKPKNAQRRANFPNPAYYAEFVGTVANRYKDRIKYFEIWNEPDLLSFANFPAESYLELLRSGYDAIKKVAPDSRVMNGGLASVGSNRSISPKQNSGLIDRLLADKGQHYDLFAYHGHGAFVGYVNNLRLLHKYGIIGSKASRPWYSNETAESGAKIGEVNQASLLVKKMLYAWSEGAIGYNWYQLRDKGEFPIGHNERHFGLVTPDFEPKPAYVTYNMLANTYKGGKFLQRLNLTPGVYACLFENRVGEGILGLWGDGVSKLICISGLPTGTSRIDLFGNEEPLAVQDGLALLQVSNTPLSLSIPDIKHHHIHRGGEILKNDLPRQLIVPAGGSGDLILQVSNPLNRALTLEVGVFATGKLVASPAQRKVQLAVGGSESVRIKLSASPEFHAEPTSPEMLRVSVSPAGIKAEEFLLPVISRVNAGEPLFQANKAEQYYSLVESAPGNEPLYWKGADDLSAKVYLSRQGNALLLKVEVRDDLHVQPFSGANIWGGDSIQFGLQLPGQAGYWKLGLAQLSDGNAEVVCWERPQGFTDKNPSIRLETQRNEAKRCTLYTAEIPFDQVGLTPEIIEGGFRFNLIVNDNDGELREGFIFVAPGLGMAEDPLRWPIVNLP